ncbi:MAG: AmmeMemoRadiSam system protein A [Alphaproteobacteria bacterium]|uniref:AmmeMemoRadiSam system protein A n=1 Tax=Candidatus Nitrobium versatile TaxID=2884831 RepID=A0A953JD51_9BACT|nr:AmmeMemoRadiSam system protein A [Candidatus Nitrobium versatile]
MHPFVELARKAVEEFVRTGKVLPVPPDLPPEMRIRAGVFVCLKAHGHLRGCVGTFLPCAETIYQEIVRNALCAAAEDTRFRPVQEGELPDLSFTVDVLSAPVEVKDLRELDPKKYGVIVVKGKRRGLLLPDLEGVDTVEEQLRIARMKAGIDPSDSEVQISKFTVERYR